MRLEDTLAELRGEAAVLRAHGAKTQADSIESVCHRVRDTMTAYLDWLTEPEAMARSGRVRCQRCGNDLAPASWVIKLHDLPPNVAGLTADDPYLPRTRFTAEGVD